METDQPANQPVAQPGGEPPVPAPGPPPLPVAPVWDPASTGPPPLDGEPPPQPPPVPREPRYTIIGNVLFTLLFLALFGYMGWAYYGHSPAVRIRYPAHTIPQVMDREMELWEVQQKAAGTKLNLSVIAPENVTTPEEAIAAYRVALGYWTPTTQWSDMVRPTLLAHLAVLLAEQNRWEEAEPLLEAMSGAMYGRHFGELMRIAYGNEPSFGGINEYSARQFLRPGWSLDRMRARLARAEGSGGRAAALEIQIQKRAKSAHNKSMLITGTMGLLYLVGLVLFIVETVRRKRAGIVSTPVETPWGFGNGLCLAVRAAAFGLAMMMLVSMAGVFGQLAWFHHSYLFWASLPMLVLLQLRYSPAGGLGWLETFGLRFSALRAGVIWRTSLWVFAVAAFGSSLVIWVTLGAAREGSALEGVVEMLFHGSVSDRLAVTLNMVAWAPLYEELLFRGILFATLRRRMTFLPAAVLCSAIWGATHFYSLPGLLAITWVGIFFCLAYERSKSLIPCMAAHGLLNLLIVVHTLIVYV